MGVLPCGRDGCQNIMCEKIVEVNPPNYREYICDECYCELLVYKDTLQPPITIERMRDLICKFMGIEREEFINNEDTEEIERVFNECVYDR